MASLVVVGFGMITTGLSAVLTDVVRMTSDLLAWVLVVIGSFPLVVGLYGLLRRPGRVAALTIDLVEGRLRAHGRDWVPAAAIDRAVYHSPTSWTTNQQARLTLHTPDRKVFVLLPLPTSADVAAMASVLRRTSLPERSDPDGGIVQARSLLSAEDTIAALTGDWKPTWDWKKLDD